MNKSLKFNRSKIVFPFEVIYCDKHCMCNKDNDKKTMSMYQMCIQLCSNEKRSNKLTSFLPIASTEKERQKIDL